MVQCHKFLRLVCPAIILSGIVLTTTPASAALLRANTGAECLWQNLPIRTRSAIKNAYVVNGSDGLAAAPVDDAAVRSAAKACRAIDTNDRRMRTAAAIIAGMALERGAEAWLSGRQVRISHLADVWQAASVTERGVIGQEFDATGASDKASAKRFFETLVGLALRAGAHLPAGGNPLTDRTFRAYIDWFLGRAQVEAFARSTS